MARLARTARFTGVRAQSRSRSRRVAEHPDGGNLRHRCIVLAAARQRGGQISEQTADLICAAERGGRPTARCRRKDHHRVAGIPAIAQGRRCYKHHIRACGERTCRDSALGTELSRKVCGAKRSLNEPVFRRNKPCRLVISAARVGLQARVLLGPPRVSVVARKMPRLRALDTKKA